MFGRKNKATNTYDPETQEPMIRCSICTGEQVAGFRDKKNGHFKEVMLIRNEKDLAHFRKAYGISEEIPKEF